MDGEEEFIEKAVEGLVLGFFNQGEVCTALVAGRRSMNPSMSPYGTGHGEGGADPPRRSVRYRHHDRRSGFRQQFDKILSYIQIARGKRVGKF